AGLLRAGPGQLGGRLARSVGLLLRRPDALAGLDRQHVVDLRRPQRRTKALVVAVEAVRDDRTEADARLPGRVDQLNGQLRLGPKRRIARALREPGRRGIGDEVDGPVDPLVGPQAGDADDAVVDLAHRPQILAGDVVGVAAVFSVAAVV